MKISFGSEILDAACRLFVPFLLLFAIYVIVHGHDSPGGGFQGGAILASTIILVRLVRGREEPWGLQRLGALRLACFGVVLFAGIGLISLFFGGNYLDYDALPLPVKQPTVRTIGSFGIEVGVAMCVTGVLTLIFDVLTAWEEDEEEEMHA